MKKIALATIVLAAGTATTFASGGHSVVAGTNPWCAPPAKVTGSTQGPTTLWPC